MNYKCLDPEEMQDNVCCGISRVLLSAPVRLAIILILGKFFVLFSVFFLSTEKVLLLVVRAMVERTEKPIIVYEIGTST